MANYIDKSAVVAEIERRLEELYELLPDAGKVEKGIITISEACNTGKYTALESFKDYIDTLEVKEVDFKLTLEDVSMIRQIIFDYNRQVRNEMSIPNDEEYCKEVLKRFKAQKGEKV